MKKITILKILIISKKESTLFIDSFLLCENNDYIIETIS